MFCLNRYDVLMSNNIQLTNLLEQTVERRGLNASHLIGQTPTDRVSGSDWGNLWIMSWFMLWPWCQGNPGTCCFMTEESGRERERNGQSGTHPSESYEHVLLNTLQPPHLRQAPILLSLSLFLAFVRSFIFFLDLGCDRTRLSRPS